MFSAILLDATSHSSLIKIPKWPILVSGKVSPSLLYTVSTWPLIVSFSSFQNFMLSKEAMEVSPRPLALFLELPAVPCTWFSTFCQIRKRHFLQVMLGCSSDLIYFFAFGFASCITPLVTFIFLVCWYIITTDLLVYGIKSRPRYRTRRAGVKWLGI